MIVRSRDGPQHTATGLTVHPARYGTVSQVTSSIPEICLIESPFGPVAWRDTLVESALPPVLLVHGWAADSVTNFAHVYDALAPLRRVVGIDLPGHGATPAKGAFSLDRCAQLVAWAASQLDEPVVVGYSMGGPVTQLAVLDHAMAPSGLVQVATAARVAPTLWSRNSLRGVSTLAGPVAELTASLWKLARTDAPAPGGSLVRHAVWVALSSNKAALAAAAGELARFDARDRLVPLSIPVHCVITLNDRAVPAEAQRELAALLAAPVTEVVADHTLCLRPQFADVLTDVLAGWAAAM